MPKWGTDPAERLWERMESEIDLVPDQCWEWPGNRHPKGYGKIRGEYGKDHYTHILAYQSRVGEVPEGMQVLHRCDNPPCCNPAHLFLGTHLQNMEDKKAKGRAKHGATIAISPEIRAAVMEHPGTLKEIAEEFGISLSMVSKIRKQERDKDV